MKTLITLGVVCLGLTVAAPAFAQTETSRTTVSPDGASTTTTTTETSTHRNPGGTAPGMAGGAVAGAVVAGPIGAVVGGVAGAVAGHTVAPPSRVRTYVTTQTVEPTAYSGDIAVGKPISGDVRWNSVPDEPKYSWAYLNGQRVVINNDTHTVVAVY